METRPWAPVAADGAPVELTAADGTRLQLAARGHRTLELSAGTIPVVRIVALRRWSLRRPQDEASTIRVGRVSDFFQPPPSAPTEEAQGGDAPPCREGQGRIG